MNAVQGCFGVAIIGFLLAGPNALGTQQPDPLGDDFASLYGQGVNAYFAGRTSDAELFLSQALALNPHDPRAYYFRALSLLRLGRLDEARGDMMVGASLEAQRPNRFSVGRALERVQGSHRLTLEQYRRQGRTLTASTTNTGTMMPEQRQRTVSDDSYVLRNRIVVPLDRLLDDGGPQPLSADELARRGRRTNSLRSTPAAQPVDAAMSPAAASNPFHDDPPAEPDKPAGPRLSQPTAAPAESAAEEDDNPFSAL